MPFYRKKPVVIEARELTTRNIFEISKWCGGELVEINNKKIGAIKIPTLEGDHLAIIGDFIIQGVHGEFYPCKPDIFEKSYETVEA